MMVPTQAPVQTGNLGSTFGWRIDPFTGRTALHTGLDFPAEPGTPIYAAAGGVVVTQEFHPQYGNMIEIEHGNDLITRYGHSSRVFVKKGDLIKRGQKIAEVGTTGRSTGPHLHFEVLVSGVPQDPQKFLNAGGTIAASLPAGQSGSNSPSGTPSPSLSTIQSGTLKGPSQPSLVAQPGQVNQVNQANQAQKPVLVAQTAPKPAQPPGAPGNTAANPPPNLPPNVAPNGPPNAPARPPVAALPPRIGGSAPVGSAAPVGAAPPKPAVPPPPPPAHPAPPPAHPGPAVRPAPAPASASSMPLNAGPVTGQR